jgi:thiol-disulfide isomerase/thioredoxin
MKKQASKRSFLPPIIGLGVGIAVLSLAAYIPSIRHWVNGMSLGSQSSTVLSASSPSTIGDKKMFNVEPYPAPELKDVSNWINSNPLTIAGLKGKVILVDFWTYSCINCQNTQPYINSWQKSYADKGLVIIGVHAPELAFERVAQNVKDAVKAAKITYPVVLDNNFSTWNAYENQYWPARYLVDKNGLIRYRHFGEGAYDETDSTIQTLLGERS